MRLLTWLMKGCVHAYRLTLSPLVGGHCRYLPTCSAYALEALDRHGPWTGGRLTLTRLAKCHPWGGAGYDPVPTGEAGGRRPLPFRRTSDRSP